MKALKRDKVAVLTTISVTAVLAFLAGYGFQRFVSNQTNIKTINKRDLSKKDTKRNFESKDRTPGDLEFEDERYHAEALTRINASYIEDMLMYLSKEPHMGGTRRNLELGNFIRNEWKSNGIDNVLLKDYYVYLSYPRKPSNITLLSSTGKVLFEAKTVEPAYFKEENHTENVYPFNAFSASGDVEGEYVFVNYGGVRDYQWLIDHKVELQGKIHIAKYGFIFRGEQARLAEAYGGIGLLIFPDPEDYTDTGTYGYPKSWEMPSGAIPRGNILNVKGDPLTPLYPAKESYFRRDPEKIQFFAKIPVSPISYGTAYGLLSTMNGMPSPDEFWQGGMNFTYKIDSTDGRRIHMVVDTPKEIRKIQNVIGVIEGEIEPDRIVMLGNHRDGWVYGALDPSSGTAVFMEVARLIGKMLKDGWRPRRTIMLCSWDAEEHGLVGSVEWGQEYRHLVDERVVTYINVDIAVSGNHTFRAKSSALLMDRLFEVTKKFDDPDFRSDDPDKPANLFESWRKKQPAPYTDDEPGYADLGSGSDFTFFASVVGVSCLDIRYMYNQQEHPTLSNYPTYHTLYDNFNYMTKFIDPDFRYHTIMAKIWLLFSIEIADAIVLPFNLTRYAERVYNDAVMFEVDFQEMLTPKNISLTDLKQATFALMEAAKRFNVRLKDVNKNDCFSLRSFNDQMMSFDRTFIIPEGLPGKPDIKHAIYSPNRKSLFKKKVFPGVQEYIYNIEVFNEDSWDGLREQLSLLVSLINSAKDFIEDFGDHQSSSS